MTKVAIRLVSLGHIPMSLDTKKLASHKSSVFELRGTIDNYAIRENSDLTDWAYSDSLLLNLIPKDKLSQFTLAIVNVPLELNWFSRCIAENTVVFTFNDIKDFLQSNDIPLENAILRMLYVYSLVFLSHGNRIPSESEKESMTLAHDETRGCLFDMNGIKSEIVESLHRPIVCDECVEALKRSQVAVKLISTVKSEIGKIRKPLFQVILGIVKSRPLLSIFLSSLFAIFLGAIGSLLASYLWIWLAPSDK